MQLFSIEDNAHRMSKDVPFVKWNFKKAMDITNGAVI